MFWLLFLNVLRIFAPASQKAAGIVLCRSVVFIIFLSYLPDMALWTKGTFQKDLTQVFETPTSSDFILLSCVQIDW